MSKFLDSRFNKISYLTPLSFFILYHPKNSLFWGRIRGRFRRVASYVLVSKNACPLRRISDGPDGPKFDVRARGFPPRAPSASPAGRGAAPSGARFAPLRVVIPPSRWAGSGCVSVKGALRPSSQSSPCSPCGLCVAPGCSGRPLTLPHPSKRAYGPLRASWIRSSGLPGPQGTE